MQALICVMFFFVGGCATDGKKQAALRDNPGCTWDDELEGLNCPLPWESKPEETLDPKEIEALINDKPKPVKKPVKKAKKAKKKHK